MGRRGERPRRPLVTGGDGSHQDLTLGKDTVRLTSRKTAGRAWPLSTVRASVLELCRGQPRVGVHWGQREPQEEFVCLLRPLWASSCHLLSFSLKLLQPPACPTPGCALRPSQAKAVKIQCVSRPCPHTRSDRACATSRTSPAVSPEPCSKSYFHEANSD